MTEPPKMLSTKDVMFIEDILMVTLIFIKKLREYSSKVQDVKIKNKISDTRNVLIEQYEALLEVLA